MSSGRGVRGSNLESIRPLSESFQVRLGRTNIRSDLSAALAVLSLASLAAPARAQPPASGLAAPVQPRLAAPAPAQSVKPGAAPEQSLEAKLASAIDGGDPRTVITLGGSARQALAAYINDPRARGMSKLAETMQSKPGQLVLVGGTLGDEFHLIEDGKVTSILTILERPAGHDDLPPAPQPSNGDRP